MMIHRTLQKQIAAAVLAALLMALAACGQAPASAGADSGADAAAGAGAAQPQTANSEPLGGTAASDTPAASELTVRFGAEGDPFTLHLYENETAAAIARHVGTASWQLPIYHYEGYEHWEVMQYYDIPSRYEIPSAPETVTQEAAGTVYYSDPNRIVLFYGDGEVTAEYTPVGWFDDTEEFRSAVENNPVLEGWGNKIVRVEPGTGN